MAANTSVAAGIASFGKRLVCQIWNQQPTHSSPLPASALTIRRAAHASAYEKNPDEQLRPSVVPDDVIQPLSDKYWAPHPQTGVFGPTNEHEVGAGAKHSFAASSDGGEDSVLEQKAWFRPTSLEDLEKPHLP